MLDDTPEGECAFHEASLSKQLRMLYAANSAALHIATLALTEVAKNNPEPLVEQRRFHRIFKQDQRRAGVGTLTVDLVLEALDRALEPIAYGRSATK